VQKQNSHRIPGIRGRFNYDIAPELEATIALRYDRDRRKEDTVGSPPGYDLRGAVAVRFGRWQPSCRWPGTPAKT